MKSYVCLTFSLIVFQLFIGQILGGHGGNGGYVVIGGGQIRGNVAQGGRGGGPFSEDGKPGIVDCGEGCVINGRRQQGRLNGAEGRGGNGGYVAIGGGQIRGNVAQGGRGGGPFGEDGRPGIVDCGPGCVITGNVGNVRTNQEIDNHRGRHHFGNGADVVCPNGGCHITGNVANGEDGGWFRTKRGNGGDGGKVYCPNCKIEGDTATGGDGGWFRKKRQNEFEQNGVVNIHNHRFKRGDGGHGGTFRVECASYTCNVNVHGNVANGGNGGNN